MAELRISPEGKRSLKRILSYKNDAVVARYMRDFKVSKKTAEAAFTAFKQFMATCVFSDGRKTGTPTIDEFWHTFILHTAQYQYFCEKYLRGFVHHEPTNNTDQSKSYFATRASAEALFGLLDKKHWPTSAPRGMRCISSHFCVPRPGASKLGLGRKRFK